MNAVWRIVEYVYIWQIVKSNGKIGYGVICCAGVGSRRMSFYWKNVQPYMRLLRRREDEDGLNAYINVSHLIDYYYHLIYRYALEDFRMIAMIKNRVVGTFK